VADRFPAVTAPVRAIFDEAERGLSKVFPPQWNPLLNLGALGFFFYWVIVASGVYLFIFFGTGINKAFDSVEYMTRDQWYAAGLMRSFHRYASDGLVVVMLVHLLREFSLDRYRGVRWFSWLTGVPVLMLVYVAGVSGYWLVWDKLAQYVAIVTTEWLDHLPFFGQPVARNFLSPDSLEDRFFTLMIFIHIAIPLIALIVLWLHLQRISRPRINPPRGLAIGAGLALIALSIVDPAVSQGRANLAEVPGAIGLDWFYLGAYPLLENLPGRATWSCAVTMLLVVAAAPWLPPMRRPTAAKVDLANCNGCTRCMSDCPYNAITMERRSDGRPFEGEAVVDPGYCVGCGLCAGACPTSTPFRRMSDLVPGIDMPDRSIASIRADADREASRLSERTRIIIFGCMNAGVAEACRSNAVGVVSLTCSGQLPPAFIDYVISRNLADGVIIAGCADNSCLNRRGGAWTTDRVERRRDPRLRERIPSARLGLVWAGRRGASQLQAEVAALLERLESLGPYRSVRDLKIAPSEPGSANA
jgi:quinol-cytochrome oxidoreductase complex cytochrome b subunit/coenzyme F420-reducing hydrogenase delta subunit/Pyruvate/2-oxoacid:ferredoxin oxidoreductase delta subunit